MTTALACNPVLLLLLLMTASLLPSFATAQPLLTTVEYPTQKVAFDAPFVTRSLPPLLNVPHTSGLFRR
jgi:hypothetical protein